MHTLRLLTGSFVLLLAVAFVGHRPVQAQQGEAALQRLQQKYEAIDALEAEFTQTVKSPYTDNANTFSGRVVLQNNKYRVETGTQTLVTNGTTTWIYTPSKNQVLINDYQEDETTFSLSDFLFNYDETYNVTLTETVQRNGEEHVRVRLKPKKEEAFFQQATFWMRDRDALVTRLDVLDRNGTRLTYTLDDIALNPELSSRTFTFTAPDDAEIVDLRS